MIHIFPSGPLGTNAYVVACPNTHQAAIIDPAPNSAPDIAAFLEQNQLHPVSILLTHSHWDHFADAEELRLKYNIPVWVHPDDKQNLIQPGSDGIPCFLKISPVTECQLLEENLILKVGDLKLHVICTPGHSPGGVCFYCSEHAFLLSGDTLFKGTIGNVSFSTGSPESMWESLRKLEKLPEDTAVFPGHGPSTTIGHEKHWLGRAEDLFG